MDFHENLQKTLKLNTNSCMIRSRIANANIQTFRIANSEKRSRVSLFFQFYVRNQRNLSIFATFR